MSADDPTPGADKSMAASDVNGESSSSNNTDTEKSDQNPKSESGTDQPEATSEEDTPNELREEETGPATYWYVLERRGEDGTLDIDFQVAAPKCPASQRALKNDVERALSTINALYGAPKDVRKLSEAFAKLLALSRVGLVGRNASPEIATDALRAFEADVVNREAGPVKNAYMRKLGTWAALFAVGSMAAFFFCDLAPKIPFRQVVSYKNFFVLWAGCMLGTWASFASRRVTLSFYDLVALEEDRVEPALRLLFAGVLTMLLGLIFSTGMANVEVGAFSAANVVSSGATAFLTGAFAGISEKVLPSAILSRAKDILPKNQ